MMFWFIIYMYVCMHMAGYWFGKMVSATLVPPQQLMRSTPVLIVLQALHHQCMATVNFNNTMACNQSFSSRCPMKSTTTEKGKSYIAMMTISRN